MFRQVRFRLPQNSYLLMVRLAYLCPVFAESKQKANKEELQKPPPGNPESVEEITWDPEVRPKNASVTHSQEENELQEVVI